MDQLKAAWYSFDTNKDGKISFDEFFEFVKRDGSLLGIKLELIFKYFFILTF